MTTSLSSMLYADLLETDETREREQLKQRIRALEQQIRVLSETVASRDAEIRRVMDKNKVLETNLSKMYHTAKAEIERKDHAITELRALLNRPVPRHTRG